MDIYELDADGALVLITSGEARIALLEVIERIVRVAIENGDYELDHIPKMGKCNE